MCHTLMTLVLVTSLVLIAGVKAVTDTTKHVVELKVVVDSLAIKQWYKTSGKTSHDEFKKELNSLFVEVEEFYKSLLSHHQEVKFVIKELVLDEPDVLSAPYGQIGEEGLEQFGKWMLNQKKDKKFDKKDYDIALLFTGNDVVGGTKGLLGFGYIGLVCTEDALAMVELRKLTYKSAYVTAHELGHVLGMQHDGAREDGRRLNNCDPKDGYIMSPNTKSEAANKYTFSHCSYTHFYYTINKLKWECLKDGATVDQAITGERIGEWMTADETCRRQFGKGSYLDRDRYWIYGDNVCSYIVCVTPTNDRLSTYAPQGMPCAKNKQCNQGKCVKTYNRKSDVSDVCPFGDAPKIDYKGYKTCSNMPREECGVMKTICCQRCDLAAMDEPDEACRRLKDDPKMQMIRSAYVGYSSDTVCQWIPCGKKWDNGKNTWDFSWVRTPPGMVCGQNKRCQGQQCLPASDANPHLPDTCPFGDQPFSARGGQSCLTSIKGYLPSDACTDSFWRKECCASCMNYVG